MGEQELPDLCQLAVSLQLLPTLAEKWIKQSSTFNPGSAI